MTERFVCPDDHKHAQNTSCYFAHRCRCAPCSEHAVATERARRRQKAYGRWEGRMPVAPVIEHVEMLRRHGFTHHALAKACGLSARATAVHHKAYVTPKVSKAILALTVEQLIADDRLYMSSRGAQRRIQALGTQGWSQVQIARAMGLKQSFIASFLVNPLIPTFRHRAIAAIYEELWNRTAPRDTREHRGSYTRVVRNAARLGWLPPLAWDDIDLDDEPSTGVLPSEAPEEQLDHVAVTLAVAGDQVRLTPAERREAVRQLHAAHLSDPAIAERLHCAVETAYRIRQLLGLPANVGADGMPLAS